MLSQDIIGLFLIYSGLDSSSSKHLIKLLSKLAREGHTIVCTIHQPSASEYELFDYVYVMAQGFCVYQGASFNTIPYLNSVGLHCPQYHSAADYSKLKKLTIENHLLTLLLESPSSD